MKYYSENFLDVNYYQSNNRLVIRLLPESQSMSQLESKVMMETIFEIVFTTQSQYILIDAYEFNYPFFNNEVIRHFANSSFINSSDKQCGFVNSQNLFGQVSVKKMIAELLNEPVNLFVFDSREEGLNWLVSLPNL